MGNIVRGGIMESVSQKKKTVGYLLVSALAQ